MKSTKIKFNAVLIVFILLNIPLVSYAQNELNFILGNWDLKVKTYTESVITNTLAEVNGKFILDQKAIQSDLRSIYDETPFFWSTSILTLDESNNWIIHWIPANSATFSYATANFVGNDFVGTGDGVDLNGEYKLKFKYFNINDDSYSFESQISYDDGRTWSQSQEITAVRK